MHYTKSIELPTGDTGEHLEIGYFHIDFMARTSSAHVHLWKSKTHRDRGAPPQRQSLAKIRLNDDLFDKYLKVLPKGATHLSQMWLAAKTERMAVISDWQMGELPLLFNGGQDSTET